MKSRSWTRGITTWSERKPRHVFYGTQLLYSSSFAAYGSVATLYFRYSGLSFAQIGILWSAVLLSTTLSDFPTGNLADKFGRVRVYSLGLGLLACGKAVFCVAPSFWVFLVGAVLLGVGQAQMSGALSSWFVDKWQGLNRPKDEIPGVFGNTQMIGSIAGASTGLLLGATMGSGLRTGLVVSAGLNIVNAVLLVVLVVDNHGARTSTWASLSVDSLRHFLRSWVLIVLTVLSFLFYSIYSVYLFLWQPMAVELGVSPAKLGYLFALYTVSTGLGGFALGRMAKEHKSRSVCLLVSAALSGIGLGLMGVVKTLPLYVVGIVVFGIGYGSFFPVYRGWSQEYIPSRIRASVTSLASTVSSAGLVLSQIAIGAAIDRTGLVRGAGYSGIVCTAVAVLLIAVLALQKGKDSPGSK